MENNFVVNNQEEMERDIFKSDIIISISDNDFESFKMLVTDENLKKYSMSKGQIADITNNIMCEILFEDFQEKETNFMVECFVLLCEDKESAELEVLRFKVMNLHFKDGKNDLEKKEELIQSMKEKYSGKYEKEFALIELPLANQRLDIKRIRELRAIIRGTSNGK